MMGQIPLVGHTLTAFKATGEHMAWVGRMPGGLVKFIGLAELAGGLGLILPAATRIKPMLTPLAAVGLVTVMVLAAGHHAVNGELAATPTNLILAALAGFIAFGRTRLAPISPRNES